MRRGVGIQSLNRRNESKESFSKVGSELANVEIAQMREQLAQFKENLTVFAQKYKKDIIKDPEFRAQFQKMCATIGVDPLASKKGFWAELLGVGDFYYELGVQIIDLCMRTRPRNGGLIEMGELLNLLTKYRGKNASRISDDDVERAIKSLKCLGGGFAILQAGSRKIVQSVPVELNIDHVAVLALAEEKFFVVASQIQKELGWPEARIQSVLQLLLQEGIAWIDTAEKEPQYWFPSMMVGQSD